MTMTPDRGRVQADPKDQPKLPDGGDPSRRGPGYERSMSRLKRGQAIPSSRPEDLGDEATRGCSDRPARTRITTGLMEISQHGYANGRDGRGGGGPKAIHGAAEIT